MRSPMIRSLAWSLCALPVWSTVPLLPMPRANVEPADAPALTPKSSRPAQRCSGARADACRRCCAVPTAPFAPTTISFITISTFGSILTSSSSAARTRSAFACSRTARASSSTCSSRCNIDKILFGTTPLKYERDTGAVFVNFPQTLHAGQVYSIDFYYSGHPVETGRFGGMTFKKDPSGHVWINTACEGIGASMWWPNKDQWRDEVQNMDISVAIPNGLVDVSNGKFIGKTDLGDGYTRWDWKIHYPINNYDVSLNIGNYVHFSDKLADLPLDFYVLPEDLDKAKKQFAQAKGMLEAYQHYFGEYPFAKDGYKLIEAPYSGMEHQSAVTYGNLFENGYLGRDWTGVGISPRFDFIIIHESGHEWFGNSITAADPSDEWIHEGWTTYLESLYVEYRWGTNDAIKYLNGYKPKVQNLRPIIAERGVNAERQRTSTSRAR